MSMVGNIPKIVGSLQYFMEMITCDSEVNVFNIDCDIMFEAQQ